MNLWLIPASDDAADANIMKTLAAPISRQRAEAAGIEAGTLAWGAKASSDANVNRFRKMTPGDYCLFYTKRPGGGSKRYCWKGVISKTVQSRKISKALWDDPDFELVYFLKDVAPIDITTGQLSAGFAEFREDYFGDAPKGFTPVDPDVVAGIVEKYGSLDSWSASLNRGQKTYWIFQGNPNLFDVDRYISTRQEIRWSVRQYPDRLRIGDEVLLWRSGADGGVIARCTALSTAESGIPEDAPELWRAESEREINDLKCRLRIIDNYIQEPIPRERIKAILPELPIFRFAQNTNYPISETDYRKILQMKQDNSPGNFSDFASVEEVISRCGLCTPPNFLRRLIASLAAKPFAILTGTSGTGKTKIAQAIALWLTSESEGYKLIPVGADWTGNDNIVGYPDGLDQNLYVGKPALELIWRAAENPDLPHFLILDEMNLSHVERYFADLLSASESHEKIPLYSGPARSVSGKELPRNLAVPPNLFIIGTVNVDETTVHVFSKVLDRANVLEFRVEATDIRSYFTAGHTPDLSQISGRGTALGTALVHAATQQADTPSDVRKKFESEMLLFFEALKPHGVEFGYRVAYEAARFAYFYHQLSANDTEWFDKALDGVVVQKLLPKLHGQRARLAPLLRKLWFLCASNDDVRGADVMKRLDEVSRSTERSAEPGIVPSSAKYPISAEKIARMWRLLNENGFASFAEA